MGGALTRARERPRPWQRGPRGIGSGIGYLVLPRGAEAGNGAAAPGKPPRAPAAAARAVAGRGETTARRQRPTARPSLRQLPPTRPSPEAAAVLVPGALVLVLAHLHDLALVLA
ncbi:unnamed protein product [Prorocentrum cordatum]|uniref:Uncharacterized protein n=1 Tax=Prorocentrum cordatum TaxID=2364126 RepID=A0ABN9RXE9_9DINO|nr:unnamed protein product [Polarella glacialis]